MLSLHLYHNYLNPRSLKLAINHQADHTHNHSINNVMSCIPNALFQQHHPFINTTLSKSSKRGNTIIAIINSNKTYATLATFVSPPRCAYTIESRRQCSPQAFARLGRLKKREGSFWRKLNSINHLAENSILATMDAEFLYSQHLSKKWTTGH